MTRLPESTDEQTSGRIRQGIDPYVPAIGAMIDEVIDPRQTHAWVARALERFADKRVEQPWRKRGILAE